ncbi:cell division protein CrgA [Kocuria rhizophila]|nr:cell division protein CrgA [Kocuria rhizophila]
MRPPANRFHLRLGAGRGDGRRARRAGTGSGAAADHEPDAAVTPSTKHQEARKSERADVGHGVVGRGERPAGAGDAAPPAGRHRRRRGHRGGDPGGGQGPHQGRPAGQAPRGGRPPRPRPASTAPPSTAHAHVVQGDHDRPDDRGAAGSSPTTCSRAWCPIPGIGEWNLFIGLGFMLAGLIMTTQWR